MRWVALAAVALLVSGCAGKAPEPAADAADAPASETGLLAPAQFTLRYASGDFQAIESFSASFSGTDLCFPECPPGAVKQFDLTHLVPAEAPVELTATVTAGENVFLEILYEEAAPVQEDSEGDQVTALLSRASSGSVTLQAMHGSFDFPPSTDNVEATIEVRTVVRADKLVPGMPTEVDLPAGTVLNFTADDIEQVILATSDGFIRDVDGPFTLTIPNGTNGPSVILLDGLEAATVLGPNTTMAAKRVQQIVGDPRPVSSGSATTWSFDAQTIPLEIAIVLETAPGQPVNGPSFRGATEVVLTTPGNFNIIEADATCGGGGFPLPLCSFNLIGGSSTNYYYTPFLDEHLMAGSYSVEINAAQAQGIQAYEIQTVIL